jgi:hypothetical protein
MAMDYFELLARHRLSSGQATATGETQDQRRVIGWVAYESVSEKGLPQIGGWGGFIACGHRWKDFIDGHDGRCAAYYEALRQELVAIKLKRGGDWHQNSDRGVPVFDDGTVALLTFRAWGDLLAAAWAEHEDKDYSYMDFYMDHCLERAGLRRCP